MKYRVKNISDQPFSFEGIVLQPGEVSGELMLDLYQKLLALNYGTILMPVEDEEVLSGEPTATQEAVVEELKEAYVENTAETVVVPESVEVSTETNTVETSVEEPAAAVAAEPVVEAPKKRGRPRKKN